jgi:hypothetical protein
MGNCTGRFQGNRNGARASQPSHSELQAELQTERQARLQSARQNAPINLTTLRPFLEQMAKCLATKRRDLTLITIGGEIYSVLLDDKFPPHDTDFLRTNMRNDQLKWLQEAVQYAQYQCPQPTGVASFRPDKMLQLPEAVHLSVEREAVAQDACAFKRTGLKILAPPWEYAFCVKMATLAHGVTRSDDALSDAAAYLNHNVMKHASSPMTLKMIKGWVRSYQLHWDSAVFRDITKIFHEKYGLAPWETSQQT